MRSQMRVFLVLPCIFFLLTAFTTTFEMSGNRQSVKMKKHGNNYLLNVTLNGGIRARLLLDTGASHTMLSSAKALSLTIPDDRIAEAEFVLANGRKVSGKMFLLESLKLKGITAKNLPVGIIDKSRLHGFDGILGMSFLNYFNFKIDVDKEMLYLYEK